MYQVAQAIASARSLVPRLRKSTFESCMVVLPRGRELAEEEVPERLAVEVLLQLAAPRERDRAALLRHEDRERVRLLGDPDRGAVARAVALGQALLERQREEARGRRDAVAGDDDGAVVER